MGSKKISSWDGALDTLSAGIRQMGLSGWKPEECRAIGSNGLILGVAAFNCWYGSRLVINHGVQGGTVFAVGATIAGGGL